MLTTVKPSAPGRNYIIKSLFAYRPQRLRLAPLPPPSCSTCRPAAAADDSRFSSPSPRRSVRPLAPCSSTMRNMSGCPYLSPRLHYDSALSDRFVCTDGITLDFPAVFFFFLLKAYEEIKTKKPCSFRCGSFRVCINVIIYTAHT